VKSGLQDLFHFGRCRSGKRWFWAVANWIGFWEIGWGRATTRVAPTSLPRNVPPAPRPASAPGAASGDADDFRFGCPLA
jgi:hypothetical protein